MQVCEIKTTFMGQRDFAFSISSKSDNFEILPYAVPSKKFKRPSLSQFSTYLKTEGEFEISTKKCNSGEPRFDLGKNLFQFDHVHSIVAPAISLWLAWAKNT